VTVSAEWFDRGWLSSEGRHRIELRDTPNVMAARTLLLGMSDDEALPALLVDTRIDHGIFPVGSLTREQGSLSPGLGSAISTLSLETADGGLIKLPGKIYSQLELDGDLVSNYKLEPGSSADLDWGAADIRIVSDTSEHRVQIEGFVESIATTQGGASVVLRGFRINSDQTQTEVGIPVGNIELDVDSVSVDTGAGVPFRIEPARFVSTTTIDDGRLNSGGSVRFSVNGIPQMDGIGMDMQVRLSDADAAAFGRVQAAARKMPADATPDDYLYRLEPQLKDVLAAGLSFDFERLDIVTPQGDINAVIGVDISESDRSNFEWANLLLATSANARVQLSETIIMMAQLMNPQAGQLEQFLVRKGDIYEIEAAYERGVMTVNGVPLALPVQ
ncbi:MAG: DUF945 family protein, partial [Woeseiaceae bacterium]|nr:DUF945 family protein [Woeseiaceae bacterium]